MVTYRPVPSERGSDPSESARIPVDIRRFPWVRKLAADYAFSFASLASFFSGDPSQPQSWSAAIERAQRHPRDRAAIARVLEAQLEARGAAPAAREAARRLADPRAVAIVTGQQAGLFGGPAFSLYKALTAVKLADRIQQEHGVPTVPVFWVEGEDHDWEEVSRCFILDVESRRRAIQLPPRPEAGRTPVARMIFGQEISDAVDELAAALPQTEFTAELLSDLRASYQPGRGMADAFARLLERMLGPHGLVVFDASDPAAKPLASAVFVRELEHAGRTWQLAGEAGDALVERGYHAQVTATDQPAALFHLDGTRSPIQKADAARLRAEAQTSPHSFSPNVLLRPVVEDALLPTICYVSGPNELAYLAQLKAVYAHFGVPMPLLYPRLSITVLDSASLRFLARHELPLEELHARDESALNRLLAASLPASVDTALHDAQEAIERSMAVVVSAVPAVDATLEGAAKSTLGRLQHDFSALRGKVISAAKKRDETLRRQFFRAQAQAFPDGVPQERAIGGVSLFNRYGPALIGRLLSDLPLELGQHWMVTL